MVKVYFEKGNISNLVAIFDNEEIYNVCLPHLQIQASFTNMIVTESVEEEELSEMITSKELKICLLVDRAKREILEDIKTKLLPRTVSSFEDLHDHVDANFYGGISEDNYTVSENYEIENEFQSRIDQWLKNGRA